MRKFVVPARPFAFDFDIDKTSLLIIDMQRDFCAPGGFGEALGNDISPTKAIIQPCTRFSSRRVSPEC